MCSEVEVVKGDERIYCETVGELAAALGIPITAVLTSDYAKAGPDYCLCGARWEELGARRATAAEGWPNPDYIIERPSASNISPHFFCGILLGAIVLTHDYPTWGLRRE